MAEYTGAKYLNANEGFLLFGTETPTTSGAATGMLAPHATTLQTPPALALVGYTGVPGMSTNENHIPVRGVGSRKPFGFIAQRRENVITGSFLLSGGATCKKILQAALQSTLTGVFANTSRHQCLPVFALGGGAVGACDATRSFLWIARHCLMNSLVINIAQGQLVSVQFEAWAMAIATGTALTTTEINEANISTAGGTPFSYDNSYFDITPYGGGTVADYAPIVENGTININNNLSWVLQRHPSGSGISDPLDRAPRSIDVGEQVIGADLNLRQALPLDPGSLSLVLDNGTTDVTLGIAGTALSRYRGMNAAEVGQPMQFSAPLLATDLSIT